MYLGPLGCGNGVVGGEALLARGLIPMEIAAAFQVLSSPVLFSSLFLTFRSSFRDLVLGSGADSVWENLSRLCKTSFSCLAVSNWKPEMMVAHPPFPISCVHNTLLRVDRYLTVSA